MSDTPKTSRIGSFLLPRLTRPSDNDDDDDDDIPDKITSRLSLEIVKNQLSMANKTPNNFDFRLSIFTKQCFL
jgi:hypothetical protein